MTVLASAPLQAGVGVWGSLIVGGLLVVSVGLFYAMRRSLGKINFKEKPPED